MRRIWSQNCFVSSYHECTILKSALGEKRKRSDAVVLHTFLNERHCKVKDTKTLQKPSITQRLRTDLGRLVGAIKVIQPVG